MSTLKSTSTPELVPRTPIVVDGRTFNPAVCAGLHGNDIVDDSAEHFCVHDWANYWGNQTRPN